MSAKSPTGKLMSFRWLGTGFDYLERKGFKFIQFGNKPVRFIVIKSPAIASPMFLLQPFWKTHLVTKRFRYGVTGKPFRFNKLWRSYDRTRATPVPTVYIGGHGQ